MQGRSVKDRLITYLLHSPAQYAIIPMQDILGLGREGHMNTPEQWAPPTGSGICRTLTEPDGNLQDTES